MCNSGESDLDVNGDKDYSKDKLNIEEFYSKDELLDSNEDYSLDDEPDSKEDCSKDGLDGDENYSLYNCFYNDEESYGEEYDGVAVDGDYIDKNNDATMTSKSISLLDLMTLQFKRLFLFWTICLHH